MRNEEKEAGDGRNVLRRWIMAKKIMLEEKMWELIRKKKKRREKRGERKKMQHERFHWKEKNREERGEDGPKKTDEEEIKVEDKMC